MIEAYQLPDFLEFVFLLIAFFLACKLANSHHASFTPYFYPILSRYITVFCEVLHRFCSIYCVVVLAFFVFVCHTTHCFLLLVSCMIYVVKKTLP